MFRKTISSISIKNLRRLGAVFTAVVLFAIMFLPIMSSYRNLKASGTNGSVETGASSGNFSWGLKRGKNGSLPEADPKAVKVLEQYGGKYLGNTNEKTIYLTFDEGYENGYTSKILDVLKANNVKAIFFITGDYFEREPELVKRMIDEGHEVGNHTMNHPTMTQISDAKIKEEIMSLSDAIYDKFGYRTRMLRAPKGEFNEAVLKVSSEVEHTNIMWSFAYKDWIADEVKGADYATEMVLSNLHNGAVILLHAVSADNANALDSIIKGAIEKGYNFGTADQLLLAKCCG